MDSFLYISVLFIVPWIGTTLGSAGVFFLKKNLDFRFQKLIIGFASGVMLAALVWSLLMPAIDEHGYLVASFGFIIGIAFLLLLDNLTPHLHLDSDKPEGVDSRLGRTALMIFAITLHNIPEGLAVGSGAGALLAEARGVTFMSVLALSLGIALQNIPEGLVVSLPLYQAGRSKLKAFAQGSLSGIVEPIASFLAFFIIGEMTNLLPYLLSFAAGAMFYVVVEELIPEASAGEHSNLGVVGSAIGFVSMMILDGIFS